VRRTAIVAVLVGAVVAVVAAPGFVKLDEPNSDGLFYEVEKLRIQGHDEAEATRMVFDAPIARQTAEIEDEPDEPRVLDPAWVEYSKRFYRRRWLVPALAAAIEPLVGDAPGRALRVASLIGYVLIAPVLFLLLRRRFSERLSAALALVCTLAPPVYKWSLGMRVDSWGLMLESLGLLAAVLVKDMGMRWLALWVAAVAALSITRDATVILLLAVLWLLWVERRDPGARRTNLALLGTGVVAALPVFFLGGTPVRENLAYVIGGFKVPEDDSWSYVASGYLEQLWRTVSTDLTYPVDFAIPVAVVLYAGLALAVAGLVALVARPSRGDPYFSLMKAALPGSALLLLLANNPQAYRLELVLVPTVAIGLATLASSR
jgi:Dolichyl-phosphate-mannose-protein mannosyltransferase